MHGLPSCDAWAPWLWLVDSLVVTCLDSLVVARGLCGSQPSDLTHNRHKKLTAPSSV